MSSKFDQKKLRNVAGGFATGITIVTIEDENENPLSMTVSSFVSISLDPPLVGFFVDKNAKMLDKFQLGGPVAISILSSKQKHISNQFAGLNKEDISIEYEVNGPFHKISQALAWYETTIENIIPAGDHSMVMCRVLDLDRHKDRDPILYYSGYRNIGQTVD